uniref:Uncharacterized protein n=1 Tax=Florenciella parvula TaxID=236787 RepID=A0A7S2B1A7_9STRA|mmetsp:Transcript_11861/g.25052  ORF Transcript_11861/g.25052 Transcript_11861/m.25052 type:complete len:158 (+) Transcript_11861:83-556(+)|eukprot:CAMPEP_0182533936 /NCGR_PEP_ID=MMETSP1323-20130603/14727_1 /TAXON_ID=236787 /ORGANISM="Florenciella parvula, Strain RCC1693" /LENGTH=157 /DNA_ID=CAMNT_0024743889 /DNA_START=83 /DNA_END=556 /DNA_ORIENTATION=-
MTTHLQPKSPVSLYKVGDKVTGVYKNNAAGKRSNATVVKVSRVDECGASSVRRAGPGGLLDLYCINAWRLMCLLPTCGASDGWCKITLYDIRYDHSGENERGLREAELQGRAQAVDAEVPLAQAEVASVAVPASLASETGGLVTSEPTATMAAPTQA